MRTRILLSAFLLASIAVSAQTYTMPIGTARALVAEAFQNRIKDSIIVAQDSVIAIQNERYESQNKSFHVELGFEKEVSEQYKARVEDLSKAVAEKDKKLRRKRAANGLWKGLAFGFAGALGIVILAQ